ncbi:MAG TPA: FAD-dependent monooxygenase [Xanthobacteraceae bacterium]|nr:FAD-dependent monooxygenase [Xanthobacteraceae bacterium]
MVIVAGGGIGGLTAALALARRGFRVTVLEQAQRLEETGAGIQLSPNATRTLIELGLDGALRPLAVAPSALRVMNAISGREIVRMPLGEFAEDRYGAPFWLMHRADLLGVLADAASRQLGITIKLGRQVQDFVVHPNGLTVSALTATGIADERGFAVLAADGLWSPLRRQLGDRVPPRFTGRAAWRGSVAARDVRAEFREPAVHLWIGPNAHLVHYPVRAGQLINIVVIAADPDGDRNNGLPIRSTITTRADLLSALSDDNWAMPARTLLRLPDAWQKWPLYERQPLKRWSEGAAALLGDAAHPMLPYLAQGAAMAIEDAAVVADCLARQPDDAARALRAYRSARQRRTQKIQFASARNGARYHSGWPKSWLRDAAMRTIGGKGLLKHYDWIYRWRPPVLPSS